MKKLDYYDTIYIGANYHPHDWPESRWTQDLDLMAQCGFTVVRLGHLCWDSFEPEDGVYTFGWMDRVMDLCAERGIGVFLDIPTRPAPVWLHKKFPSIDITDRRGLRQNALSRYMEDVGDPHFQEYAYRLAAVMAKRYRGHPALLAFGLCNELGSGFLSYSETARGRFVAWLKKKYCTAEELNRAWASQRWGRKLQSFEQVDFPVGSEVSSAPERYLDMRRFFSDELVCYLSGLKEVVSRYAPGVPVSTNHWSEYSEVGFDYNHRWRSLTDFPGQGFYPGTDPGNENGIIGALFFNVHRAAENPLPGWNLEFQTGSYGIYACPPGAMRMYACLTILYHCQAVLAWTWRSMLGGEEQYVFGLLDHDGEAGWKLEEFRRLASDARLLEKFRPFRRPDPRAAVAYSFEDSVISDYARGYYTTSHREQATETFRTFYRLNQDCAMVDLRQIEKLYPVLILPGSVKIGDEEAESIRRQLENGGTVIMTAFSAKVDENNQFFDEPLPGRLSEIFGIKVRGFGRSAAHAQAVCDNYFEKGSAGGANGQVSIVRDGEVWMENVDYHEYLELTTAEPVACYQGDGNALTAAVSCHPYGKGKAVYVGVPAAEGILKKLLERMCGIGPAFPELPHGIVARRLEGGETLYINTTAEEMTFPASGDGLLTHRQYRDAITLPPYEVELIIPEK